MRQTIIALLSLFVSLQLFAGEYIIKQKANMMMTYSQMEGLQVLDSHPKGQLVKVNLDEESEFFTLNQLHATEGVEYVVKNFKLKAFGQFQCRQGEQWAIPKVNAKEAWNLAGNKGNRQVVVAVIDTGVDYNHEALAPNMMKGYDFRYNDNDPMDETSDRNPGHGTHVAGIIGATGLTAGKMVGLSPNVTMMPIRFLGADGSGDLMAGIKAVDYAIENKADIISASWGAAVARSQAGPLIEAVQRADDAGVIFIAAAANDGKSNDTRDVFPANAGTPNMISVAASGSQDEKPQWSNFGKHTVDLAAPGLNIQSTLPNNQYCMLSGTSMATPLVSGLVALLLAQDPNLTGKEVRSLIQSSATKVQIETACNCRVDALGAVKALLDKKPYVVPFAKTVAIGGTETFTVKNATGNVNFSSSNASVGSINDSGVFTASAAGETTITATDAAGNQITSDKIYVRAANSGGGGGGGACPIGDPQMCEILCGIQPDLPFCN